MHTAKVRSRISNRSECIHRGLNGDPEQRYLGYIPASRRYNQAVPPDPPASPVAAAPTPPPSTPPPDSFDDVYATIPDSALSGIDMTSDEPLAQDANLHPPSPHDHHPPTPPQWDGSSNIKTLIARLNTPSPSFPETPPSDTRAALHDLRAFLSPYAQPCNYPDSVTATPRDIDLDYEGVMITVNDLNRLTKFVCGRVGPRQPDPTGSDTTRGDVIEMLAMLKTAIDRLFTRLEMVE